MKPFTQAPLANSLFARANAALRNKDYQIAIKLYNEAIVQIDSIESRNDSIGVNINFNLYIAKLRLQAINEGIAVEQIHDAPVSAENKPEDNDSILNVMRDIKNFFDSDFYCAKYLDIEPANIEPIQHYCVTGWLEGRDPRSDFSTTTYLDMNPDVAEAGINPFWHYVVTGKTEGRPTSHPGGYRAEILKTLPTLIQMGQQWKKLDNPPESMTVEQVTQLLTGHLSDRITSLVISVGHDHYRKVSGGIQVCIQREEQLAHVQGMLYLNVHPWQPLPTLASAKDDQDPLLSLVLAGIDAGNCRAATLTLALKQIALVFNGSFFVVIHSLLGHAPEHVTDWVRLRDDRRCWFWLHDFFSLCPSYALQRNNITFCGAPPNDSNACTICIYGEERRLHTQRIDVFFKQTAVVAISPSEVTKQFWLSKASHLTKTVYVVPHMELQWLARETEPINETDRPVSIGFLGGPVYHKGWNTFEKITQILAGDTRFKFYYFGNRKPPIGKVQHVNIHVTADDCFAMTRAVSEAEIDYIIHWATWPETFSFTAHEAIAGGAYILTNKISGNVAAAVTKTGMGVVFPDEDALTTFFKEGEAEQLVKTIRKKRAELACKPCFSAMAIPLMTNKKVI